jgi:hypothetical protein
MDNVNDGWQLLRVVMSGAAGSGELQTQPGLLMGVYIAGNPPGTVDITLYDVMPSGAAAITLLTLTNVAAPYDCIPQKQTVTETGAASGNYAYRKVGGRIRADVAQGVAGNTDIWLLIE